MLDKKNLLKELDEKFNELKKELGFKVSLEELDMEFNIKNDVLAKGFVPELFFRYLCSIIADNYRSWHGYFNGLLMPSSGSYASQVESKVFGGEEDKKVLWKLIKKTMAFSSGSALITVTHDKELAKKFIDEAYHYSISEFRPALIEIMKKVNDAWKKE